MILYLVPTLWAATENQASPLLDLLKAAAPGIMAALTAILTLIIGRRFAGQDKKVEKAKETHNSDVEQMVKQREFIIKENEDLWHALRKELEACRFEREKLEGVLDNLKKRLSRVENELTQWELGLKTPAGFRLVKIVEETD